MNGAYVFYIPGTLSEVYGLAWSCSIYRFLTNPVPRMIEKIFESCVMDQQAMRTIKSCLGQGASSDQAMRGYVKPVKIVCELFGLQGSHECIDGLSLRGGSQANESLGGNGNPL